MAARCITTPPCGCGRRSLQSTTRIRCIVARFENTNSIENTKPLGCDGIPDTDDDGKSCLSVDLQPQRIAPRGPTPIATLLWSSQVALNVHTLVKNTHHVDSDINSQIED